MKYLSFKQLRPVTADGETIKYWRLLEGSVNSRKYLDNCWDCGLGKATLWTPYLICQRSVFRITSKSLLDLSQLRGFKPLALFVITYSFGICQQLYTETLLKQFTSAGVLRWVLRNPSKEPKIFCRTWCEYQSTLEHDILTAVPSSWSLNSSYSEQIHRNERFVFGGRMEIHLNNEWIDIPSTRWSVILEGQIPQTIRKSTINASPLNCESAGLREFVKDFRASKSFEKQCIWRYSRRLTFNDLPEFALSGCLHPVCVLCRLRTEPLRFQTHCVSCSVHLVSTALTTPLKRR